jgi:hypothetical protein
MRRWRHVSARHRPAARSPNVQAPCPLPGRHGAGAKPAGLLPARGFRLPGAGRGRPATQLPPPSITGSGHHVRCACGPARGCGVSTMCAARVPPTVLAQAPQRDREDTARQPSHERAAYRTGSRHSGRTRVHTVGGGRYGRLSSSSSGSPTSRPGQPASGQGQPQPIPQPRRAGVRRGCPFGATTIGTHVGTPLASSCPGRPLAQQLELGLRPEELGMPRPRRACVAPPRSCRGDDPTCRRMRPTRRG